MSQRPTDGLLHGLRRLAVEDAEALTDTQLLRRFAADRDEGAFTVLVHRYGRLVQAVCRNILRNDHDAEDAAQATFLVLARRAAAIREGQALGGWLYRVAYRVATKARGAAERRRRREARVARPDEARPAADLAWRDLQAMLDEELNRLPYRLRTPFVLCILGGKSKAEAAADLGWKEGTVSSRLAKARERIRGRLARRGVALSAILSGLAVAEHGVAVQVPGGFVAAARAFADGQAVHSTAADLARGFLRGASVLRFQLAASAVAVLGLGGLIAAATLPSPELDPPAGPTEPIAAVFPVVGPVPEVAPAPNPMMRVSGSVLGPDGQPVPGTRVALLADRARRPGEIVPFAKRIVHHLGEGATDPGGAFNLTVPQTTLEHNPLTIFAHAPGYALISGQEESAGRRRADHPLGRFNLVPGRPVRGRVMDAEGKPVAGLRVDVVGLARMQRAPTVGHLISEPPARIPGWPDDVVTDADGVFTIEDMIEGTFITIQVRDDRYAKDWIKFTVDQAFTTRTFRVGPPRVLSGRVTAADTGEPVRDATVLVESQGQNNSHQFVRTDPEGRYTVPPFVAPSYGVSVYPPAGAPFVPVKKWVTWPEAAAAHTADVTVPRGVVVRGTVVEAESGRPVAGAGVGYSWSYWGARDRSHFVYRNPCDPSHAATAADGTFTLTVPIGPG
ncbi:MAG TPA: sigma-70 family RNA polymerase sigma factor, partial [Gemmataceae bacterium]|nr:sigma-70 family RNA polymerase sigma factor [Gemmataceae bacterium]